MMHVIPANSVDEMLFNTTNAILDHGNLSDSRNGSVMTIDGPVCLQYNDPKRCILDFKTRPYNPFLFLFDAVFMYSDYSDVSFLAYFAKSFGQFSNDGYLWGDYGRRMANGYQLENAIDALNGNRQDRRVVIQLWDRALDLSGNKNDHPCNLMILPRVNSQGELDLTVYNRSNDVMWGACGANAVQFAILQQVIAARLELLVGTYYQISNNLHAYTGFGPFRDYAKSIEDTVFEEPRYIHRLELFDSAAEAQVFQLDCANLVARFLYKDAAHASTGAYHSNAARKILVPALTAFMAYKDRQYKEAMRIAANIDCADLARACCNWLELKELTGK